jgi:hypothetical protein
LLLPFPVVATAALAPHAHSQSFYLVVFRPETACQAQRPPNPLKQNKIELSYELPSTSYSRNSEKTQLTAKTGANLLILGILAVTYLE